MKNLECSSKGDKRFSAFYAKVNYNGKYDSIENIYQSVKYCANGDKCKKGQKVAYVQFKENGYKYNPTILTPFYRFLWYTYLYLNKDLVEYAKQFDSFTDMFRGKSINCQADCIRAFINKDQDFFKDIRPFTRGLI